jgi:putative glutamine amidotransferase
MQVVNVALGGTLLQDLPGEIRPFHGGGEEDRVHPVRSREGTLLHRLYGPIFPVNSAHHQAVDRLGEGLETIAWAESGFPEALIHTQRPVLGVQFHPGGCGGWSADLPIFYGPVPGLGPAVY